MSTEDEGGPIGVWIATNVRRRASLSPSTAATGRSLTAVLSAPGLNWLRAGVLGANDGIISTAGLVIGVAAATTATAEIATAGIAGLVAGAVSMALGEYVSVSTQRDSERALISKERGELEQLPSAERGSSSAC